MEILKDGIFSLSPDQSKIAFQIRQAVPASNRYCIGMFVLDRRHPENLTQIDAGGEFLGISASGWNIAVLPAPGIPMTITPQWSSDGQWIAYLRRDNGSTQVWRAKVDGSEAKQITHMPFDVEGFAWLQDDQSIVIRGRPGLTRFDSDLLREGLAGYHFDERILPSVSARPVAREPIATEYFAVALSTGGARPATDLERSLADPASTAAKIPGATWSIVDPAGDMAWVAPKATDDISAESALHMRHGNTEKVCADEECQGIADAWFDPFSHAVIYLRRAPGNGEETFYQWAPQAKRPTLLYRTENLFSSCRITGEALLCGEEEPDKPRRLVELDLQTKALHEVFDPNPQWANLQLGTVRRLYWTNSYGIETYGDLVLPPDHKPGDKHPLIVVGYAQRGFLRGGTGDEYPIFALAAKGYAVLSYQSPKDVGFIKGARTWADLERIDRVDWLNYRSTASSVETGINTAVALGVVDESKVGLTGLSFGASIAQFELVNSRRFSAAILSTCCEEESNASMMAGLGFSQILHQMGYPGLTDDSAKFWAPISFRENARSMSTPTLFEVADREFLGTVEGVTALTEINQPVDEYVFPGETHIKWQPAHRLAIYKRNIDWFDFWLKGKEDPDPAKAAQYKRWEAMRDQQKAGVSAPAH